MCVKIISQNEEKAFDTEKPLEQQIDPTSQIVVNYEPSDVAIMKFLQEMERISQEGIHCSCKITVDDNNFLAGSRLKAQVEKLKSDITVQELMRLAEASYKKANDKLEELAQIIGRI